VAIHVVTVPITGDGKSLETAFRPDFGSVKVGRWGQASSVLSKGGKQTVWVECDDGAVKDLENEAGAVHFGEVVKDGDVLATKGDAFTAAYRTVVLAAESVAISTASDAEKP